MKIFANSKIWKKIVIIMTIIFSVSFFRPKPVEALPSGGELLNPINYFVLAVDDAVMGVIHLSLIGQGPTLVRANVKEKFIDKIKTVLLASLVVVLAIAIGSVAGIGIGIAQLASYVYGVAKFALTVAGPGIGIIATIYAWGVWLDGEVVLPLYSVTPEQIFRNPDELPLFSVNFWNPDKRTIKVAGYETVIEGDESLYNQTVGTEIDSVTGDSSGALEMPPSDISTLRNPYYSKIAENMTDGGISQKINEQLGNDYSQLGEFISNADYFQEINRSNKEAVAADSNQKVRISEYYKIIKEEDKEYVYVLSEIDNAGYVTYDLSRVERSLNLNTGDSGDNNSRSSRRQYGKWNAKQCTDEF